MIGRIYGTSAFAPPTARRMCGVSSGRIVGYSEVGNRKALHSSIEAGLTCGTRQVVVVQGDLKVRARPGYYLAGGPES
jgi:hypothetical protein